MTAPESAPSQSPAQLLQSDQEPTAQGQGESSRDMERIRPLQCGAPKRNR